MRIDESAWRVEVRTQLRYLFCWVELRATSDLTRADMDLLIEKLQRIRHTFPEDEPPPAVSEGAARPMPPMKNFERLIEEESGFILTLACGHTMPAPKLLSDGLQYAICETCIEAYRQKLAELSAPPPLPANGG